MAPSHSPALSHGWAEKGDGAKVFAAALRCAVIVQFTPGAGGAELAGGVKTSAVTTVVASVHHFPAWGTVVVVAAVLQNHLS